MLYIPKYWILNWNIINYIIIFKIAHIYGLPNFFYKKEKNYSPLIARTIIYNLHVQIMLTQKVSTHTYTHTQD